MYLILISLFTSNLAFSKHYATGYVPHDHDIYETVFIEPDIDLPSSYDWRTKFDLPIKDQGNCGSCWAFSITAVLEAISLMKGTLSEQTMVDCSHYNCSGGDFDAFDFARDKGMAKRADYPYTARNGRCKLNGSMQTVKIKSWSFIKPATTEAIKTAILKYGPVSVTVAADSNFMNYKSGVYKNCAKRSSINHMVNIVGWDDSNGGYWIMRNSWGTSWGEKGYMKIAYTDRLGRKCNHIADEAAFALLD